MNSVPLNELDIEIIEKYINGELNRDEVEAFDLRLTSDPEFFNTYNFRKKLPEFWLEARTNETIKEEIRKILEPGLSYPEQNESSPEPEKKTPHPIIIFHSNYRYSIAAGFLILIGAAISGYFVVRNSHTTEQAENTYKVQNPVNQPYKGDKTIYSVKDIVRLIRPDSGFILNHSDELTFQWHYVADSISHFFIFKKGISSPVYIKTISSHDSTLTLPAKVLTPGEYYWSVGYRQITKKFIVR